MKTEPGKYYKNAQALKQILKPKVSAHKKDQILKEFYDEAAATDSELAGEPSFASSTPST